MSGPLPAAAQPLAVPVAWVYGRLVAARNRRYDGGHGVQTVGVPVISVGNLTAGGVGKTPFVTWLARRLTERGHRPVVAMRGYAAPRGAPGDEEREYAARVPDVPVVTGADRAGRLRGWLPAHPEVDCVLLDDGFQHRRLHRDLDVVLVDAARSGLGDRLLPAGLLREPVTSLRRADAVVVTRARGVDESLAEAIALAHGAAPVAWSRHAWTGLRLRAPDGAEDVVDAGWLEGKRVAVLAGIGHPDAFVAQVRAAGAAVVDRLPARDHQRYTAGRLRRAARRLAALDALVMTGKDWVKARPLIDSAPHGWPVPIIVPDLTLEVFAGADPLLALVLRTITNPPNHHP